MPRPRAQSTHSAAGTLAANFLEDLDPFAWDFLGSCSPQWMPGQWARAAAVVEALQSLLLDEDTQRPTQLEYYSETWGLRAGRQALLKLHATAVRLLSREDSGTSRASADDGGGGRALDSDGMTSASRRALAACSRTGLAITNLLRVLFSLAAFGRLMKARGFTRDDSALPRAVDDVVRACIASDMLEGLSRLVIFGRFQGTTERLRWIGAAACLVEHLAYLSRERFRAAKAASEGIANLLGYAQQGVRRAQPLPFEIMEAIDRSHILQHLARAVLLVRQPRHHQQGPTDAATPSHPNPPDAPTAAAEDSNAALGSGSAVQPGAAAAAVAVAANAAAASSNGSSSRNREAAAAADGDGAPEGDAVDAEEEGDALRAVMQALHVYMEVCDAMAKDEDWNGTTELDVNLQYVWLAHVASQVRAAERSRAANSGGNRRNGGGGVGGSGGGGSAGGPGLGSDGASGAGSGDAGGSSSTGGGGATGDGTVYGLSPELLPAPVLECCGGCSRPGCKAAVKVLRTNSMRCVLRYWVRAMEDGEPQIVGPAGKCVLSMRLAAVATAAWQDWHDAKEAEAKASGAAAAADAGPSSSSTSSGLSTATTAGGGTPGAAPAAAPKRPLTQKQLRQVQQQQAKQVKQQQQQQSRGKQQQQDAEEGVLEITGPPKHVVPGGLRPEGCPLLALDALITASQAFLYARDEVDRHLAAGSSQSPGPGPSHELGQGQDAGQERGDGQGQGGEEASAGGSGSVVRCAGDGRGGGGDGGGGLGNDGVVHGVVHGVPRPAAWWRVVVAALRLLPGDGRALADASKHGSLTELLRQVNRFGDWPEDDEEGTDEEDDGSGSYETVDSYDTDEDAEELARSRFNNPKDRAVSKSHAAIGGSGNRNGSGGDSGNEGRDEEDSSSDEPRPRALCRCHLRRGAAASHSDDRGEGARRRERHICSYADFTTGVSLGLVPALERLLRRGMPQLLQGPYGNVSHAIRMWVNVCKWSGLQPLLEHTAPRQGLSLLITAAKLLQRVFTARAPATEEMGGVPTLLRLALPEAILDNLLLHAAARCGGAGSASGDGAPGAQAASGDAAAVAASGHGGGSGSGSGGTLAGCSGGGDEGYGGSAAGRQGDPTQPPPASLPAVQPHGDVLFASFAAARLLPAATVLLRQLCGEDGKAHGFSTADLHMLQAWVADAALLWVQLVCRAYQLAVARGDSAAAADWRGLLLTGADVFWLLDVAASLPEPPIVPVWHGNHPLEALALVFPEEMAAATAPHYAQVVRPAAAAAEGAGPGGKRARTPPPPALSLRDALRHSLGPGGQHKDVACLRRLRLLWQWRDKGCGKDGGGVGDKDAAARRAAVGAVQHRLSGLTEAASLLVPPHELSRLLPACGNPCCGNVSGDSEVEVPLRVWCADCGAVSYCSVECREAHGRLWHKDVCAAMLAASEGRGQQLTTA